jgi:hypothetical protein
MNWNLIKEQNIQVNNNPFVLKDFFDSPNKYLSWGTVNQCLYRRDMDWQLIDSKGYKMGIPSSQSVWYGHCLDTQFMCNQIIKGCGFVIQQYGRYDKLTNDLLFDVESNFCCASDLHAYGGTQSAGSFQNHCDETCNFIIQVEGTTPWTVYNESFSFITSSNFYFPSDSELTPALEIELTPGDLLYIPAWRYHRALPNSKRLSMSVAMMQRYHNTPCINRQPLLTIS